MKQEMQEYEKKVLLFERKRPLFWKEFVKMFIEEIKSAGPDIIITETILNSLKSEIDVDNDGMVSESEFHNVRLKLKKEEIN